MVGRVPITFMNPRHLGHRAGIKFLNKIKGIQVTNQITAKKTRSRRQPCSPYVAAMSK